MCLSVGTGAVWSPHQSPLQWLECFGRVAPKHSSFFIFIPIFHFFKFQLYLYLMVYVVSIFPNLCLDIMCSIDCWPVDKTTKLSNSIYLDIITTSILVCTSITSCWLNTRSYAAPNTISMSNQILFDSCLLIFLPPYSFFITDCLASLTACSSLSMVGEILPLSCSSVSCPVGCLGPTTLSVVMTTQLYSSL